MLLEATRSCVLAVDLQERLMPAVQEADAVVEHSVWLIQIANRLAIPVLASEQYPQGLGPTVAALKTVLPDTAIMSKTHFSCTQEPACWERINTSGRDQFVLLGAEAHVCVLQTALGLRERGKAVYVVAEGVSSRRLQDKELALARMRAEGVQIVSREMVAFEWLERAATEPFREISRAFLR
ncbi:MAG: hydrolase [Candidatus Competibacteraceae bacterium]|jgi:nicotinamidase-related amidase|nr:hydrolase [Candidatus Competibacteraceae bacterium]